MKGTKMLKKIGTVVLSAALMLSLSMVVFANDGDNVSQTPETSTSPATSTSPTGSTGSSGSMSSGSVNTRSDAAKTVDQRINGKMEQEIFKALSSGSNLVKIDGTLYGINSLSRDMVKELSDLELDAEFSFNYDGSHYVVTIPAGTAPISDDVTWFGPKYLISLYEDTTVVTAIE